MRSAVFLERDGILCLPPSVPPQTFHQSSHAGFEVNESAVEPLRELKAAGFLLVATTNQPGLSRGYVSRSELDWMHALLKKRFPIQAILVCPHDEHDRCPCRKPRPGLLYEAAFNWHIDLERSFVISDKWQDAEAAHNAGCTSLLIKSPLNGSGHRDFMLTDLRSAVRKILQLQPNIAPSTHSSPAEPAVPT